MPNQVYALCLCFFSVGTLTSHFQHIFYKSTSISINILAQPNLFAGSLKMEEFNLQCRSVLILLILD